MGFDVVMLTSAHQATDDRIFYREARCLSQAGYSVCVVGRHPRSEVVDGVAIRALPDCVNRLHRFLLARTVFSMAIKLKARLYIVHDPELLGIALLLRGLGKKVVYDAHENLPALMLQKDWLPKIMRWLLVPVVIVVEWLAGRALSGVIAAVPAIHRRFPKAKTVLVRNFPTANALTILQEGVPLRQRANVVIYAGGLSPLRGISDLVESFRGLESAELWLVGNFDTEAFRQKILSSLPENVVWLGWRSHPEVLRLYRLAKLGAVLLHPTRNHRCALPVKLFEYMGAGLPVIASNFPEYTELVAGCGVQVDPLNVKEIRRAIRLLLADNDGLEKMSSFARERVRTSFSWEQEGRRFRQFCETRMAPKEPRAAAVVTTRVPRHP